MCEIPDLDKDSELLGRTCDISSFLHLEEEVRIVQASSQVMAMADDPDLVSNDAQEMECDTGRIVSTPLPNKWPDFFHLRHWDIDPHTKQGPHTHDCAKVMYVVEGEISITIDGRVHQVERGGFFHIAKGIVHESESVTGCRLLVLVVEGHPEHGKGMV